MEDNGSFRSNLYYQISAFPIERPSLKERRSDFELLSEYLLKHIAPTRDRLIVDEALAKKLGMSDRKFYRELQSLRLIYDSIQATRLTSPQKFPSCHHPHAPEYDSDTCTCHDSLQDQIDQ